jgi:hypothetical protein
MRQTLDSYKNSRLFREKTQRLRTQGAEIIA